LFRSTLGRKTRVTEDSAGLAWITDSQFDRADQKRCQDDLLDASDLEDAILSSTVTRNKQPGLRIPETCGHGDMYNDTKLSSTDTTHFTAAGINAGIVECPSFAP
ncbi:MAG: hypothetical protein B6D36_08925, partial [Planctomycetes bacterium UTPLA1]